MRYYPIFRALWIAQFVSYLGTWMQTVGAQWMLVEDPQAAVLVPLVQTATALPVMLLALPAGVLADLVDRRRLLLATQGAMAADLLCRKTKLWVHATSLGGVESTFERRRRWRSEAATIPDALVRMSVGIEDVNDLWDDLVTALDDLT